MKGLLMFALALALAGCRPAETGAPARAAFEPPAGKRAFTLSIDRSQVQFLAAGDAVEVVMLVETPRADGGAENRAEALAPRAEVLRVKPEWGDDNGLVQLALTPEEAQYAALAIEREDRLFLNKLAGGAKDLQAKRTPARPALEAGQRGLAVLVYADQQEFLEPGDRVDVIASKRGYKAGGKAELTALTLLQDTLVLAGSPPDGDEEWASAQLMVEPAQAERLARAVAAEDPLTLVVRPAGERSTKALEPAKMSRKLGFEAERANPKS